MTTTTYDANAVLMGGGGPKGWKFADPGDTHTGTIAETPKAVQEREYDPNNPGGGAPKTFPSGDPIMGVHVVLQTTEKDMTDAEDDGKRTFFCEGRYLKEAVRNAVRTAGGNGLEVGGQLTVTFTHREDPMDKRSRKFWDVKYVPAANATLMTDAQERTVPASTAAPAPAASVPATAAPAPAPATDGAAKQPTPEELAAFAAWQAQQQAG